MISTTPSMPALFHLRIAPKRRAFFESALLKIFLCLILAMSLSKAIAQATDANAAITSPERVKAVYLYKFLNYVDWPASAFEAADSPYVIGVMGADDVADELDKLSAASTINHRAMKVKRLQAGDAVSGVHVLFIGRAERRRQSQVIKQLQSQPVLLVTETEGALNQGSMINFRIVDERVRFEVAVDPVEKAGLKLNTRLLSVAITVLKRSP